MLCWLIFFVLLIIAPVLFTLIFNAAETLCNWAGVPSSWMQNGIDQFRFWEQGP